MSRCIMMEMIIIRITGTIRRLIEGRELGRRVPSLGEELVACSAAICMVVFVRITGQRGMNVQPYYMTTFLCNTEPSWLYRGCGTATRYR